jgi:hypothetical protein
VSVVDVGGLADWVRSGRTTNVIATVVNHGDGPRFKTLAVTVDGVRVAERTVTVQPGERRTVPLEFEARPGTVAVDGTTVGQLTVSESYEQQRGTPTDEAAEAGWGWTLSAGTLVALLAVAGAGILFGRYR